MAQNATQTRELHVIADEIRADWSTQGKGVNYAAEPYLNAMSALISVTQTYGVESGASVVRYFLANATTWRGDTARRVKAELKNLVKGVY